MGLAVLCFSILAPVAKLGAIFTLTAGVSLRAHHRAATYRFVEWVGRWGVVDVLLVAVLVAIVKLGEQGAIYASAESVGYVPAFDVEVADTVAAGDAFGGALGVALAEGSGLEDAVRFGSAAGALAVTRPGAQEAMPRRVEVERLLGAGG